MGRKKINTEWGTLLGEKLSFLVTRENRLIKDVAEDIGMDGARLGQVMNKRGDIRLTPPQVIAASYHFGIPCQMLFDDDIELPEFERLYDKYRQSGPRTQVDMLEDLMAIRPRFGANGANGVHKPAEEPSEIGTMVRALGIDVSAARKLVSLAAALGIREAIATLGKAVAQWSGD